MSKKTHATGAGPKQFDVMVTTNMFGGILSGCAALGGLSGSSARYDFVHIK